MLQIVKITLSSIAYITEEEDLVRQALLNCVPKDLHDQKIKKQSLQSQFGDKLILFSLEFIKKNAISVISYIESKLDDKSKSFLERNIGNRIDLEGKAFFFRLDKFKAVEEELEVTTGSDVIKVEMKYNAYTQQQNSIDNVILTLKEVGMIHK